MMRLRDLLAGCRVIHVPGDLDREISGIAYDSRQVQPGFIFVAIRGLKTDGNRFAATAAQSGAAASGKTYDEGDIPVLDFHGKSLRQAMEESRKLGLKVKSEGTGHVTQQFPPAGAKVRFGTVVEIRLSPR